MLQWSEKRRTVEITATCLGPPDQPLLWISCKKNSLAWGCELIQDYPWKHHISLVVSSPAGSNTEGPILSQNLLWKLFNMFSLLQRIKPLSSSGHFLLSWLSLWHSRVIDPARTGTGARLMSMHCGWHWAGNLLQPRPGQGSLSIMSDRPVQLHHLPYKYFTSSFDHCFPSAHRPQLVMLTWTVWWDILATTTSSPCLPPQDLNSSLPCMPPQVQPHDICAICRKCLSRPGGWK